MMCMATNACGQAVQLHYGFNHRVDRPLHFVICPKLPSWICPQCRMCEPAVRVTLTFEWQWCRPHPLRHPSLWLQHLRAARPRWASTSTHLAECTDKVDQADTCVLVSTYDSWWLEESMRHVLLSLQPDRSVWLMHVCKLQQHFLPAGLLGGPQVLSFAFCQSLS